MYDLGRQTKQYAFMYTSLGRSGFYARLVRRLKKYTRNVINVVSLL